jgi:hypothetical protein
MKHLAYVHTPVKSLVETLVGGTVRMLAARLLPPNGKAGGTHWGRRLAIALLWILALGIQAALVILISELVEIIHGVMELYLDLAQQQLDLTSIYVAATTPK